MEGGCSGCGVAASRASALAARTEADRELYSRQITATDREIDNLVYELYGLTEEEIRIVEGTS